MEPEIFNEFSIFLLLLLSLLLFLSLALSLYLISFTFGLFALLLSIFLLHTFRSLNKKHHLQNVHVIFACRWTVEFIFKWKYVIIKITIFQNELLFFNTFIQCASTLKCSPPIRLSECTLTNGVALRDVPYFSIFIKILPDVVFSAIFCRKFTKTTFLFFANQFYDFN